MITVTDYVITRHNSLIFKFNKLINITLKV